MMKQYKGFYVDGTILKSKQEIDDFLEKEAVRNYKTACQLFAFHSTAEYALYCDQTAERLVNDFGYTWEQVEEIECEAYKMPA